VTFHFQYHVGRSRDISFVLWDLSCHSRFCLFSVQACAVARRVLYWYTLISVTHYRIPSGSRHVESITFSFHQAESIHFRSDTREDGPTQDPEQKALLDQSNTHYAGDLDTNHHSRRMLGYSATP